MDVLGTQYATVTDTPLRVLDALDEEPLRVVSPDALIGAADPWSATYFLVIASPDRRGGVLGLVHRLELGALTGRPYSTALRDRPLVTCATDESLDRVWERLERGGLAALAVVDGDGRFAGVVSRPSLFRALLRCEGRLRAQTAASRLQLQSLSQRLGELHQASRELLALPGNADEADLARRGLKALMRLVGARYGAVALLDEAGRLRDFIPEGATPREAERIGHPPEGKGLLGVVIHDDRPLRIDDMGSDPRAAGFPPHHPPMTSLLAAPVSYAGNVWGRIYLCDRYDGESFSDEDETLVGTFAQTLALVVRNHRNEAQAGSAQAALTAQQALYRNLVEQSLVGVFLLTDGRFLYVNPRFAEIFGYDISELGQAIGPPDLATAADRGRVASLLEANMAGRPEQARYNFMAVRKDGRSIVVEAYGTATSFQGHPAIIGTLLDITERHQTETEKARLLDENRRLAQRLLVSQEQERRRVGRELHNELSQLLAAIQAECERLRILMPPGQDAAREGITTIADLCRHIDDALRDLLRGLLPPLVYDAGIVEALGEHIQTFRRHHPGIACRFVHIGDFEDLDEAMAITLFRVVQECLTNTARHSIATRAVVGLRRREANGSGRVQAVVRDNGRGFDPVRAANSLGLIGMRERVQALGGRLRIDSGNGKGTRVEATLQIGTNSINPEADHGR